MRMAQRRIGSRAAVGKIYVVSSNYVPSHAPHSHTRRALTTSPSISSCVCDRVWAPRGRRSYTHRRLSSHKP